MKRVVLHIDRLVLNGFAREDRHAIVEGLRDALGRHFATPDAAARLAALPTSQDRMRVGIGGVASASAVAARLADAIARGLRR